MSTLTDRIVAPGELAAVACHWLLEHSVRRLAVVDEGVLVGLLCLKRHRAGLCGDADVAARSEARRGSLEEQALERSRSGCRTVVRAVPMPLPGSTLRAWIVVMARSLARVRSDTEYQQQLNPSHITS